MDNQRLIEEDEIDLRECVNVVVKRKKFILSLVITSVIVTALFSLLLPKTYVVSMVLEPPVFGITIEGNNGGVTVQYLDSANNIAEIIKSGAFDSKILEALNLEDKAMMSKLQVSQIQDTSFLKVSLKQHLKSIEIGKKVLNALFQQIASRYQEVISGRKKEYEKIIENINNEIANLNNAIKQGQQSYKILEEREKSLSEEAKAISENTRQLLHQREYLLNTTVSNGVSSLLFTSTIQQNISYSNQLNNELSDLRTKSEATLTQIKSLQIDIENKKIEIEKNNLMISRIFNIRAIQEPTISPLPVGMRKLILVVIASICSLLVGVFLAFFMEYWQKGK
jgi:capsular polysaccharide biosynthesis protein